MTLRCLLNLWRFIHLYRQFHYASTEAGGTLIGERRGKHIVITHISEPGLGDVRSRTRIERKGEHHQQKVDDLFQQSDGSLVYLGEWHTHPEDFPKPSSTDMRSWRIGLRATEPMVLLIMGRKQAWCGKKHGNVIKKLEEKNNH
ncbi:Mov34/MPN/PAD-1 family protein [Morganella morganii]|uniref:CBASS system CD-NTase/cGAS isopeptidase Cap3 n=1 Tax=Morganella morganii TaxID=582 RepID=UPI001BDA35A4|nr:Mov34/MPN/PAD-1 family protein [Morganella morganii]MBT0389235.1 Mov34/MPN/PAD-1 family protein [Morganella morganii subsp. morganii]HEJ1052114.1 Mov34/MPN/PAD-1 family protein [Morganella morganii]